MDVECRHVDEGFSLMHAFLAIPGTCGAVIHLSHITSSTQTSTWQKHSTSYHTTLMPHVHSLQVTNEQVTSVSSSQATSFLLATCDRGEEREEGDPLKIGDRPWQPTTAGPSPFRGNTSVLAIARPVCNRLSRLPPSLSSTSRTSVIVSTRPASQLTHCCGVLHA